LVLFPSRFLIPLTGRAADFATVCDKLVAVGAPPAGAAVVLNALAVLASGSLFLLLSKLSDWILYSMQKIYLPGLGFGLLSPTPPFRKFYSFVNRHR
jgi:hypothetical protein